MGLGQAWDGLWDGMDGIISVQSQGEDCTPQAIISPLEEFNQVKEQSVFILFFHSQNRISMSDLVNGSGSKNPELLSKRRRDGAYDEEENQYSQNDFYAQIQSFDLFRRGQRKGEVREIPALVNIIGGLGVYETLVDRTKDFRSVCYLVKDEFYHLLIIPSFVTGGGSQTDSRRIGSSRTGMKQVHLKGRMKNCGPLLGGPPRAITIGFKTQDRIDLQFKFNEHFEYFNKVLQAVGTILQTEEEDYDEELQRELMQSSKKKKLVVYQVPKQSLGGKVKKFIDVISEGVFLEKNMDFYEKPPAEWTPNLVQQFLQHIYFQEGRDPIVTMYDYLVSQIIPDPNDEKKKKHNLWHVVEMYVISGNTVFNIEREMKHYHENRTCDPQIEPLASRAEIRRKWKKEMNRMRNYGGRETPMFNMPFSLVLRKRLGRKKEDMTLRQLETDLQYKNRMWWDPIEMRDHILCMLVFRKELKEVMLDYEKKFLVFEEECLKRKYAEEESDLDTPGSMYIRPKDVDIDPQFWLQILREFRESNQVQIDMMSFKVYMKGKQNLLRLEKKKAMLAVKEKKEEKKHLEEEMKKTKITIDQLEDRIGNCMERMFEYMETKPDFVPRIEKMINMNEEKVKNLKVTFSNYEEKVGEVEKEVKILDMNVGKEWDTKIEECVPEMNMMDKGPFLGSPNRRLAIQRFLKRALEDISRSTGMTETVAKLVLSIRRGEVPKRWQANTLKLIDPLLKPGFFKWGFLHGSCLLSNLGIHWFNNSLCFLNELAMGDSYQEVICVDANCPLMMNYRTIYEKINQLAFKIVFANVNCKYVTYNMWGGKDSLQKNCQEFTYYLLESLDNTQFFPEVRNYFDLIKEKMSRRDENRNADALRFLRISNRFEQKFGTILKGKFKMKKEKRGKMVYLKSHADLDDFYIQCSNVDPYFDLNYPGVCQLLKGFDRAFWMRLKNNPNQNDLKPGIRCPMK